MIVNLFSIFLFNVCWFYFSMWFHRPLRADDWILFVVSVIKLFMIGKLKQTTFLAKNIFLEQLISQTANKSINWLLVMHSLNTIRENTLCTNKVK